MAWRYGPVVPSIYRAHFTSEPIDRPAMVLDPIGENWIVPRVDHSDDFVRDILARIRTVYGNLTPGRHFFTHPCGAWAGRN